MKYIKGFDSLRGISIIFVLLTHLGLFHLLPENNFTRERIWMCISGNTGVLIFFTLSGFLITKILLHEINDFQRINFKHFYIRRFLRLLPPLMVFYILIVVLMHLNMIQSTSYGFIFSILYLYNYVPNKFYTGELGHTWSLAVEEQYYLIWPFIVNFFNKRKGFIFIIVILILCIISLYIYPELTFTKSYKSGRWFIPAVAPIMIGSFFAWLIDENESKYSDYFKQNKTYIWAGFILFLFPLYSPLLKLASLIQSSGISIILIWLLFHQESKFTLILNNKFLSFIGTISYGLYIYQGLFLRTGPTGKLWIQQLPQNIILTFLTATISYYLLEKPILKIKNKYKKNIANNM